MVISTGETKEITDQELKPLTIPIKDSVIEPFETSLVPLMTTLASTGVPVQSPTKSPSTSVPSSSKK